MNQTPTKKNNNVTTPSEISSKTTTASCNRERWSDSSQKKLTVEASLCVLAAGAGAKAETEERRAMAM